MAFVCISSTERSCSWRIIYTGAIVYWWNNRRRVRLHSNFRRKKNRIHRLLNFRFTPKFGAILLLSTNIGYFISFTAGLLLPYKVVPMVFVGFPIVFLILMLFLPESPVFLMMNEKMEVTKISKYFSLLNLHHWFLGSRKISTIL